MGETKKTPYYLAAYDMLTEKLVWEIPILSKNIIRQVGELIAIQDIKEKKVSFLHSETGADSFTLKLPENSRDLHINDSLEFAYQLVEKETGCVLIGGKIVDQQWQTSFEREAPLKHFYQFSTHCGFKDDFGYTLTLFGPTGDQLVIHHLISAMAHQDKLFSTEKDLGDEEKCLLTIRSLKTDCTVVSGIEKTISIDAKRIYIEEICTNGTVVLFASGDNLSSKVIFIDLNHETVIYSEHKIPSYGKTFVSFTGDVWTWDELSKKIWKISAEKITLMGSLDGGRGITLLHADADDQLYFVNIPY